MFHPFPNINISQKNFHSIRFSFVFSFLFYSFSCVFFCSSAVCLSRYIHARFSYTSFLFNFNLLTFIRIADERLNSAATVSVHWARIVFILYMLAQKSHKRNKAHCLYSFSEQFCIFCEKDSKINPEWWKKSQKQNESSYKICTQKIVFEGDLIPENHVFAPLHSF